VTDIAPPILLPFGMGVLPAGLAAGDPRLPVVRLGAEPLRLNSEPLPAAAMAGDISRHADRVEMMRSWLKSRCGDYAPRGYAFIDVYLAFVSEKIRQAWDFLQARLASFHTLYEVTDWFWSALRPIPRAWIMEGGQYRKVDFAFWDGVRLTEFDLSARNGAAAVTDAALRGAEELFASRLRVYDEGWVTEKIPSSPFRQKFTIEEG
jgi:hypothetical protein